MTSRQLLVTRKNLPTYRLIAEIYEDLEQNILRRASLAVLGLSIHRKNPNPNQHSPSQLFPD